MELCVTLVSTFVQFVAKPTPLNVGRQRSINRTWQHKMWLAFLHKPPALSSNLPYLLTYLITYLLTYLFTFLFNPWNRVLLQKLTGFQLVMKFSAFYGTRRFITSLRSARHLSLS
jgi:hypothetical protein